MDVSLIAIEGELTVLEDEEISFYLKGNDTSGLNRTLRFQIRTLPRHGDLVDANGRILGINKLTSDESSYPYDKGSLIKFVGKKDFFNEPYSLERGFVQSNFTFTVVAPNDGYKNSYPVRQEITVININDPPVLTLPYTEKTVHAFSSLSWDPDDCREGFATSKCKSKMITDEIKVNDVDGNIDFVRVDISSSHGMLSLNSKHLNKTDFASCSNRTQIDLKEEAVWNCKGGGNSDREMVFIARPLDLNEILRNLTYESLEVGEDTIFIAIYDGEGGGCLSSIEHAQKYRSNMYMGTPTIHRHCTSVVRSLSVKVEKYEVPELWASRKLPLQLKIACSFAVIVFALFTVILPLMRWRNARKELNTIQVRGKKRRMKSTKKRASARLGQRAFSKRRKKRNTLESISLRSESSSEGFVAEDYRYSDEDSCSSEYDESDEESESSFESLSSLEGQENDIPVVIITNNVDELQDCSYDAKNRIV